MDSTASRLYECQHRVAFLSNPSPAPQGAAAGVVNSTALETFDASPSLASVWSPAPPAGTSISRKSAQLSNSPARLGARLRPHFLRWVDLFFPIVANASANEL